jgi:hypothetical protein
MGFIVSQSIEELDGLSHDSFYVRIENYQVNKFYGYVGVSVAHYDSYENLKASNSDYLEDRNTAGRRLNVSMSYNGEWKHWPMWNTYPLTQSVMVTQTNYSSSWHPEVVNYIDFDDEGNEITGSREEWFETVYTSSMEVPKTLINISLITGSVYDYAYNQLKNTYGKIFGSENIIDK